MSLSEEVQKLVDSNREQANRICELNDTIAIRGRTNAMLSSELNKATGKLRNAREANTDLVHRLGEQANQIETDCKHRAWVITTWLSAHGFTDGTPHDTITVSGGCVRELLDGLAAVDQGRFQEWKRKVTGKANLNEPVGEAAQNYAAAGPAPEPVDDSAPPLDLRDMFLTVARLIDGNPQYRSGYSIEFKYVKD